MLDRSTGNDPVVHRRCIDPTVGDADALLEKNWPAIPAWVPAGQQRELGTWPEETGKVNARRSVGVMTAPCPLKLLGETSPSLSIREVSMQIARQMTESRSEGISKGAR